MYLKTPSPFSCCSLFFILTITLGRGLFAFEVKPAPEGILLKPEGAATGTLPPGWSPYFAGRGNPGTWEVKTDGDKKVFAQVSTHGFGLHFDSLVFENAAYQDMELKVKIKAVSGARDQGGGLVWRFQDRNNYYVARINPLEGNFRLYKMVQGKRKILANAEVSLSQNQWYLLTIKMKGDRIEGYLGDVKCFEIIDETFSQPGKIGFWTKADAVTYFDDFFVTPLNTEEAK
ncbi:MAG: family 16 glycoside hydrolase [Pseudomonadota bacterium]